MVEPRHKSNTKALLVLGLGRLFHRITPTMFLHHCACERRSRTVECRAGTQSRTSPSNPKTTTVRASPTGTLHCRGGNMVVSGACNFDHISSPQTSTLCRNIKNGRGQGYIILIHKHKNTEVTRHFYKM